MSTFVISLFILCSVQGKFYLAGSLRNIAFSFYPEEIRELSIYTLSFLTSSSIESTAKIKITLPSACSVVSTPAYSCSLTNPKGSTSSAYCESDSSTRTITIHNFFASGAVDGTNMFPFEVKLNQVTNPISSKPTDSISISVTTSSGTVIDSDNSSKDTVISAVPASISAVSLSSSSQVVGNTTSFSFTVTPRYSVPAGSVIHVKFPYWNGNMSPTTFNHMITASAPACAGLSNIGNSLSCSYSTVTQVLKVSNGFTSEVTGSFSFQVASGLNPPNPNPVSGFVISLKDSLENDYEVSNVFALKVSSPNLVVISDSSIQASSKVVSTSVSIDLICTLKNPMTTGFLVDITVPAEFSFDNSMGVTGKNGIAKIALTRTITGNKIRVTNGYSGYSSSSLFWVQLTLLTTPASTKTTGSFTVSTLTAEGEMIDTGTGGSFTAIPGIISSYLGRNIVTADSYTVEVLTTYYFEFVVSHSLPSGAAFTVTFPSSVSPKARTSAQCTSYISNLSASAMCSVSGQVLTVLFGYPNGLLANNSVKFGINQVTNPVSSAPTSSFSIVTFTDSTLAYQIDLVSTDVIFTALPTSLKSVIVSPSSDTVGQIVTLTFTIVTSTTIPTGGSLTVTFPSGLSISDTAAATLSCFKLQGFNSSNFPCAVTSSSISITSGFSLGPFSPGTLKFSIGSATNPMSTKPVQSFSVTTFDSSGYSIDSLSSGISLKVSTLNTLISATLSVASLVNGESTSYTFEVSPKTPLPSSCVVILVPPTTVTLPSFPSCFAVSSSISSVSCGLDSEGKLKVNLLLTSSVSSGTGLSFGVRNVKNPPSTQPSSSFGVFTYTSDLYGIDKLETGVAVTTTTAATIPNIYITAADSRISVATSYTISYVPVNNHPAGSTLSITIPNEFSISLGSCSSAVLSDLTCTFASRLVTTSAFSRTLTSADSFSIKISGITNPSTLVTTAAWGVVSRTGSYLIDSSQAVTSFFTCDAPCLTCKERASKCDSCLSSGDFPYLYSDTCNSACPAGQLDEMSTPAKVCVLCQSLCKTCSITPSNCTSCNTGNWPYLYQSTCNSNCLPGFYGNGSACLQCLNPCLTCSSSTECLSCTVKNSSPNSGSLTFLSQSSCVVSCPSGYMANKTSFLCDKCSSTCKECSTSVSSCTSCETGLYLLSSSCVGQCPMDSTYIISGSTCLPCSSPCSTCSGSVSSCLTCMPGYSLLSSSCIFSCPSGYVSVNSTCYKCKSPCATCQKSTSVCLTCVSDFVLYSTTCLLTCPDGYVSNGISCDLCTSNCFTCSLAPDICTSCTNGLLLLNYKCINDCGSDRYVAIAGVCEKCKSPCATCSSTTSFCKTCIPTYKLYKNDCIPSCPSSVSIDLGSSCIDCNTLCKTCSDSVNTCTSCNSGKFLESSTCVDSCSGNSISVFGVCTSCDSSCFTCLGTTNNCTACRTGLLMFNWHCYSECPENYKDDGLGNCVEIKNTDCNAGCTVALRSNSDCDQQCNVFACDYDDSLCLGPTTCLDGQYQLDNKCYSCQDPCNKCTAPKTCLSCSIGVDGKQWLFYQVDSFCYQSCPTGTFKSGIECLDCSSECKTCSGSRTTCTSCSDGYLMYNSQCINKCPSDVTVQVNLACIDCDSNCKYCSLVSTNCSKCETGKVLQGTKCKPSCDLGFITLENSSVCEQCQGCLTCSGSVTNCISCSPSLYLHESLCINACPSGTFANGNTCKKCDSTCVTCSASGTCTSCPSDRLKYLSLCLSACPAGFEVTNGECTLILPAAECTPGCTSSFLNNNECEQVCNVEACVFDNGNCQPKTDQCSAGKYYDGSSCVDCSFPCLTCQSQTTCTTCGIKDGKKWLLYGTQCYSTCPARTMPNGIVCQNCNSNCEQCAGTVDTCVACASGKFLFNQTCVVACPNLYYVAYGTVCEPCSSNCQTCSVKVDNCTSCSSGKVLEAYVCKDQCSLGYTLTTAMSLECQKCSHNCLTCSGETFQCLSCVSGYFMYNGQCISVCPSRTTVVFGTSCKKCESPCSECALISSNCTLCITGYSLSSGRCLESCPAGFESVNSTCKALCSDNCSSNNLLDAICQTSCNTASCNYDNGLCIKQTVCNTYQYQSGSSCIDCSYPCLACTSASYCLSCKTSKITLNQLYYYKGSCYDECPAKTYLSGITCLDCSSSCFNCTSTDSTCISCSSSLKLYKYSCLDTCPVGSTIEISGICYDCSSNCQQCAGTTSKCTKCYSGSVLSAGTCISSCLAGFVITGSSNGECVKCSSNCKTCISETTKCISCPDGTYLFNTTCVSQCPSGFTHTLSDPTLCAQCISACVECQDFAYKCTACHSGYKLSGNSCLLNVVSTCPAGYTLTSASGTDCYMCESPCLNCSGTTNNCTACPSPLLVSNGNCVTCTSPCQTCSVLPTLCLSCIESYYLSGTSCKPCSNVCLSCSGSSNACVSCAFGYLLSASTCIKCESPCMTCSSIPNNCTSCIDGKFLLNFRCVSCDGSCLTCEGSVFRCTSCRSGYFLTSSNECSICSSSCKTCEVTSNLCSSCHTGKILIGSICGNCDVTCGSCSQSFDICDSCSGSLLLISGKCSVCSTNCTSCVSSFSTCASCKDGYFLKDGSCLVCDPLCKTCSITSSSCLSCYSPFNLFGSSCQLCEYPCRTCSGTAKYCLTCEATYTLMGSSCKHCEGNCSTCAGTPQTCTGCGDGFYLSVSSCLKCDANCLTCDKNPQNCLSCVPGGNLTAGTCYYVCADGFALIGANCVPCDPNCKTCAGSVSQCTSCNEAILFNNTCLGECPKGYYLSASICRTCSDLCLTCDTTSTNCLSCKAGYNLLKSTCELICQLGMYFNKGLCYPCSANCLTCESSGVNCLTCKDENQVISSLKRCEIPCSAGSFRNEKSGICESCSSQCKECSGYANNCSLCNKTSQFLYQGGCYDECPKLVTVAINTECVSCSSPCKTCSGSSTLCLSCIEGKLLYFGSCVSTCPSGFAAEFGSCVKCEFPDCNSPSSSNTSESSNSSNSSNFTSEVNTSETNYNQFTGDPVPFPFTGATVATAGIMAVSKLTAPGVNFINSVISVWGLMAAGSWMFLGAYLPTEGPSQYSRRLNLIDASDLMLSIIILVILTALLFHFFCNLAYTTGFLIKLSKKDKKFSTWRKNHRAGFIVLVLCSYFLSFHSIRALYSGMCNLGLFKVDMENFGVIKKGLVKFGYISIFCTHFPMIAAQVMMLNYFERGYWIWMFSLDSLIVTVILTFFIFCDLRKIERDLLRYELEKALHSESDELKLVSEVKETPPFVMKTVTKGLSRSFDHLPLIKPEKTKKKLKKTGNFTRKFSLPRLDDAFKQVDVSGLVQYFQQTKAKDEPLCESILNQKESSFIEDTTFIEEPPSNGEFFFSVHGQKTPVDRPKTLVFVPFLVEPKTEEFTEIVAFTEEDSKSSSDDLPSLDLDEPMKEDQSYAKIIQSDEDSEHLGTILEETELELEKAIADLDEPDFVTVPHKETGRRVKLKKDFKGARVVDLENNVIESLPPLDPQNIDYSKTIVDDSDVRFAMITTKSGQRLRVKRNFKGARIVDLEKRTTSPFSFLIGKSVENEQEFKFTSAYPDPEDPEVVIVTHKETGEDVKVRKTFQNASLVDDLGQVISAAPPIERSDFDIHKTIVDSEDVHLATLSHKLTKARVRVRRDFKGAKIVDLENKAFPNSKFETIDEALEFSEPEQLSLDLSDLEFPTTHEKEKTVMKSPKVFKQKESPERERLKELAKIIQEESKASNLIVEHPKFIQNEEFEFYPEPEIPHYRDLDEEFDFEFRPHDDIDDSLELLEFDINKKSSRKKERKLQIMNDPKARELGEIYLEVQGVRGTSRRRASDDQNWSDMERSIERRDITTRTAPLGKAGEQIIQGKFKK